MSHEFLYSWLDLDATEWPPNHYCLLGLKPGENDLELIEQHVHQRLDCVRCYQMKHPEQATEVLNRLAEAYCCLTEPNAKKLYDAGLLGTTSDPANETVSTSTLETATTRVPDGLPIPKAAPNGEMFPAAALPPPFPGLPPCQATPPPLPAALSDTVVEPPAESPLISRRTVPPVTPSAEKIDPILETARSARGRKGLATRWGLFRRIRRTRRLYAVWQRVGKFLGSPRRRGLKGLEADELAGLMAEVVQLRCGFARILGEAGQPGYLVLSLARGKAVATYLKLEKLQREALSRDWHCGRKLLLAYRDFLREQAAELRLMTRGQRFGRAVRAFFTDQPAALALLLILLAANFFLWRATIHSWAQHSAPSAAAPLQSPAAP